MPNHIQNRLIIHATGDQLDHILSSIGSSEMKIDFRKIIPPPDNIFLGDLSSQKQKELDAAGIPHWYGWNSENWGTKWNAYNLNDARNDVKNEVWFQTAWASPDPIIEKLAKVFPTVRIDFSYADEDCGNNAGRAILENGMCFWNELEGGSNEAYELRFELDPDDKDRYILTNKGYQYKEEE